MGKKLIALIFGLFSLANISLAANYTIESYDVDMILNIDGSMHIQETITINFSSPSHGIIRKIATKNPNNGRITSINTPNIQDDPFSISKENGYVSLKIWDLNKTIIWSHQYKIDYKVDNAIVSFENNKWEELYWNIIGTERNTSIKDINFSVTLPKEYQSNGDNFYAVRGKIWEKKKENLIFNQDWSSNFKGKFTGNLVIGEWISIYIPFSSKYFSFPENYNDYFRTNAPNFPTDTDAWKKNSIISASSKSLLSLISLLGIFFLIFFTLKYRAIKETSIDNITNNDDIEVFTIWKNGEKIKEKCLAKESSKDILETSVEINIIILYIFLGVFFIMIFSRIFSWNLWFLVISLSLFSLFLLYKSSVYRGKKPIIPYYLPPKNLDPILLFAFAYNNRLTKWLMAPLLYYRASKKWIKIRYTNQSSSFWIFSFNQSYFSIILDEKYKEKIGLWIFNTFFYWNNELIINSAHNNSLYSKITKLNHRFQTLYKMEEKNLWWTQKKIILKYFSSYTLTEKWKALYDQLNGFRYYLEKVERPQIEELLKEDPEYISKILPRVALFGLNDKLSKKIWDLMETYTREWFEETSNLGWLTLLSELNSSISSNEYSPSSDSWDGWWNSGSSGSWSSWWGGGGWGGSSW